MSDNQAGTLEVIAIQISRLFGPVRKQLANGMAIDLFADLGVLFPPQLTQSGSFGASSRVTLDALPGLNKALLDAVEAQDFAAALTKFLNLQAGLQAADGALQGLANALNAAAPGLPGFTPAEVAAFANGLPDRIFNWSAVTYIEDVVPEIVSLFDLLGVVERTELQVGSTDPKRPQYTSNTLRLDRLPRAVLAPFGALEDLYGLGGNGFTGAALFARLASILSRAGLPALNEPAAVPPKLDLIFAELSTKSDVSPPGLALLLKTRFNRVFHFEAPPLSVDVTTRLTVPPGGTLTLEPNLRMTLSGPGGASTSGELRIQVSMSQPALPIVLIGRATGSRLEMNGFTLNAGVTLVWDPAAAVSRGNFQMGFELQQVHLLIEPPAGDGFLSSILPANGIDSTFDVGVTLGASGFALTTGGGLTLVLPLHLTLGPATIESVSVGVSLAGNDVAVPLRAVVGTTIGPVTAVVEGLGVQANLSFPAGGGNLGPLEVGISPTRPTGIGIALDGAGVSGGGFLSFDESRGRYAGSIELSVFSIAVKAFGLLETRFPDGRDGFSLVVVISAEFTPVQLGFGFTLNGVGGLLGVNRGFVAEALGEAVRSGSVAHLLFPRDPVRDAPAILNDLETIFPASPGHHVFGPMAKLGWGTPTLITADLGIVIEFPGPRLAVVGVAQTALPTRQFGLVRLNLAIAGVLDFPKRTFSLDASLFDSVVGSFPVSGDAAFRLSFGDRPNFALSIGGFNPSFKPPANFPKLARVAVDLGVNGNPSLTLQGYLALTSNTAQIGAAISLRASGAGIRLTGHLSFDALFVFSPFSFEAAIDAGVRVSFHGVGIGVHLHGHLSGPTPWRVRGEVCVSVLWWDACLGFDASFGKKTRAELPAIDPWNPLNLDPELPIIGLMAATIDPRNWSGSPPPAALSVISLAEAPIAGEAPPIDPMGAATFRQKVVPLNQKITKFGAFKPVNNDKFTRSSVSVGTTPIDDADIVAIKDQFAPAQFKEMKAAERLSAPAYEDMEAGFTIDPELLRVGPIAPKVITYETELLDGNRQPVGNEGIFTLTQRHLRGMLARSATGIRRTGPLRYVVPNTPVKVRLPGEEFATADRCAFTPNLALTGPTTHVQAALALEDHLAAHPEDIGRFTVVPRWELAI